MRYIPLAASRLQAWAGRQAWGRMPSSLYRCHRRDAALPLVAGTMLLVLAAAGAA